MMNFSEYFASCEEGELVGSIKFENIESLNAERQRALCSELIKQPPGDSLSSNFSWEEADLISEFHNKQTITALSAMLQSYVNDISQAQRNINTGTLREIKKSGGKSHAISELVMIILEELSLISFKGGLYCYMPPVWRLLDKESIITFLKSALSSAEILGYLNTGDYKKIYSLLLAEPRIQISEDDITKCFNFIVCRDGIYDFINKEILQHRAELYAFSCINVSVYDIQEEMQKYD